MTDTLKGSCFCKAVAYESGPLLGAYGHCHCRTCQKTHSAPFITTGRVDHASFKWTKGADLVTHIESTPGKLRHFCPKCGTHMMAEIPAEKAAILRIASLDTPVDQKAAAHIWTSHKAWFFEFGDDLPKLPEAAPKPT